MVHYCAVFGCLSSSKRDKHISFFRFPTNETRCKEWVQATGRPELMTKGVKTLNQNYFVCDLHFLASFRLLKKLKTNAIPTVNLPKLENAPPMQLTDQGTQTESSLAPLNSTSQIYIKSEFDPSFASLNSTSQIYIKSEISSTSCATQTTKALCANLPWKRKMLRKLKTESMKRKRVEDELAIATTHSRKSHISPQLQKLIDGQNQLKHNSRGNRYANEFKSFALSIYFASPLAYRILAKTISLPCERTLRRLNINTGNKVSPGVLSCLESKIETMKEAEKYCTICADEMSLKRFLFNQMDTDKNIGFHEINEVQTAEPAKQAFVVMARGVFSSWKQPLGYCFPTSSKDYKELNTWLDDLIANILNIGFYVVAFVSDQGTNFLNLAKDRDVSIDKPYFFINEKKIFYIFDIPHLMISVRDNLMKYDFEFNDVDGTKLLATWKSIETFYKEDIKRAYRLAPKLTESHMNPNNIEKTKIKFASQVFSKTVAAAMNCSIELGQLENINLGTVKFIELMNNTFDILNSSSASDPCVYKKSFAAKPYQIETLDRFLQVLSEVIVYDKTSNEEVTNSIKCFDGLKISIKSITDLSECLRSKDFRSLFTRRLNKDPLEIFFDSVRQQGKNSREPTPVQFSIAFKKLFMANISKH